jgi:RNA polymerase sigma-70 factor (ECF subfamily)
MNAALDMLRREKKPVDIETLALVSAEDKVEARFEQRERINLVRRAVLGLPEASRAVLILREYEGLSYAEIASALDIPAGTVMSRLSYARKSLQDKLYRYMEES